MCKKLTFILTLTVIFISACSEIPGSNIDAEPALGVLGGAILGTQNTGVIATAPPQRARSVEKLLDLLNPIPEAFAVAAPPDCPAITGGSCSGSTLKVYFPNCQSSTADRAGLWHTYVSYEFPSAGDCANALSGGFDSTTLTNLVGETVVRDWGESASGDQNNVRVGRDGITTYVYGSYNSGWQDDRIGGVEVTFETTSRRRIDVKGVHAIGVQYSTAVISNLSALDPSLLAGTEPDAARKWDHTINTVKTGDSLFAVGPPISFNGTSVSYGSFANDTTASFDGDIVVNGNTVSTGATLRVQHNLSESIGVLTVTSPLVYSDSNCCWPMSGTVHVEYDRNLKSPTLEETIEFTGSECGAINYTTTMVTGQARVLSHCF